MYRAPLEKDQMKRRLLCRLRSDMYRPGKVTDSRSAGGGVSQNVFEERLLAVQQSVEHKLQQAASALSLSQGNIASELRDDVQRGR